MKVIETQPFDTHLTDEVYVCRDVVSTNIRLSINDTSALLTIEDAVALIEVLTATVEWQRQG
jgi:hypothetical protein